jgi:Restriction endonuclease
MATDNLPPGRVIYSAPAQLRPHEAGHSWTTGMSPLLMASAPPDDLPTVTLSALLTLGSATDDGRLVEAVATPWFRILELIKRDPKSIYEITPDQWEQIIAGAYTAAGFDEVVLTPRSGDHGRDVIAPKAWCRFDSDFRSSEGIFSRARSHCGRSAGLGRNALGV